MKKIILGLAVCTFLTGTMTAQQDTSRMRHDKSKDRNMNQTDKKKRDSGNRDTRSRNNRNDNNGNNDYGRDRNNMRTDSTRR